MRSVTILIKPASSACNMRCRYCFYADVANMRQIKSYGLMSGDTAEALIEHALRDLEPSDDLRFVFQGGEPTLAGLPFFEDFVAQVAKCQPRAAVSYSLQTNGLLIDEDWCRFLKKHDFLVGLSLDGFAAFHDENRLDAQGKGTQKRVLAAMRRLREHGIPFNILWVLTESLAGNFKRAWDFLEKNDIAFVQFIPCLGPLEEGKACPQALRPQSFAKFYCGLFDLWAQSLYAGRYRSVKLFDDLFNLLIYRRVTACGFTGQCRCQLVVEADGSVYPCDFYVTEDWCLGNMTRDGLDVILQQDTARNFETRWKPKEAICERCPYRRFCGGGCPRMFREMYVSREGDFCGYREFLDSKKQKIDQAAVYISRL